MSSVSQSTLSAFQEPSPEETLNTDGALTLHERLVRAARRTARERYWNEYDRDAYTCPVCGSDGPLEVHHRDGDPLHNHLLNLVAVCSECHTSEHRTRHSVRRVQDWKDEYSDLFDGGES